FICVYLWQRHKTKSAGEFSPPSKVLTGPASSGGSVCAPPADGVFFVLTVVPSSSLGGRVQLVFTPKGFNISAQGCRLGQPWDRQEEAPVSTLKGLDKSA